MIAIIYAAIVLLVEDLPVHGENRIFQGKTKMVVKGRVGKYRNNIN